MKIKILFFVLGAGLILAGCTDKTKMTEMEKEMHVKDSTCTANTQMLMDSILTLREEMMMLNKVGTSTTTTTKTTVTPATPAEKKKLEVGTKEGSTTKGTIDIKKKGGTTSGGGN